MRGDIRDSGKDLLWGARDEDCVTKDCDDTLLRTLLALMNTSCEPHWTFILSVVPVFDYLPLYDMRDPRS